MPNASSRLVAEFVDAWNAHDVDRIAGLYASTYEGEDVGEGERQLGQPGIRHTIERYLRAFPDFCLMVDRVVAQHDQVALFWTARGVHGGTFINIPPTGRTVTIRGSSLLTVQGAKITSGLHIWDVAGLLRAMGLLPDL